MTKRNSRRLKFGDEKSIRFGMIMTDKQKKFIQRAVEMSCQSLTGFILGAAIAEAGKVLDITFSKWQKGTDDAAPTKTTTEKIEKIRCTK